MLKIHHQTKLTSKKITSIKTNHEKKLQNLQLSPPSNITCITTKQSITQHTLES